MTEQEQKIWDKAWEQGVKQGRYEEFIQPLIRYILMGLMVALGVIFGISAIVFIVVCFTNWIAGLIGLFIGGSLCGVAWAVFIYLLEEC